MSKSEYERLTDYFPDAVKVIRDQVLDEPYKSAVYLATVLYEKYYKDSSPDWKPLDDIAGVITQIDNMTAGLKDYYLDEAIEAVNNKLPQLAHDRDMARIGREGCMEGKITGAFLSIKALKNLKSK